MGAVERAGGQLWDAVIHKGVPLFVAFGAYGLGAPAYVVALILLSARYWFGPVLVYMTQRAPTLPRLRMLEAGAALPATHARFLDNTMPLLEGVGFRHLATFVSADQQPSLSCSLALLQHRETSDLAHVGIATKEGHAEAGETLAFSRARIDGSRIATVRNTVQSPFPPNQRDSVLRVNGAVDPLDLWLVHRTRVAADTSAKRNDTVTDAFRFQMESEREGVRERIESGLWQQDERPELIRPTARGALLMCLRMLAPWKQLARTRARWELHRLLKSKGHGSHPGS